MDLFQKAVIAYREGRIAEASAIATRLLAEKPDDVEALHFGGIVAFGEQQFGLSAARFARAAELAPGTIALWSNLGNALLSNGETDRAIEAYGRALGIDPNSAETHYNLGAARRLRDDPAGAARAYSKAVELGLVSYDVYNQLGVALKEDGRLREAEIAYRRALDLAPRSAAVHVNLGNALGDQGRLEEAVGHYNAALALDPGSSEAHYNLFAALYDDGDPAVGEACLRRAVEARPDYAAAHYQLGALIALAGDVAGAEAHLAEQPIHLRSSLAFVLQHRARLFTDSFRLLDYALEAARKDGLVLELGVRHGTSIAFIAKQIGSACTVHGFDSFEGLPQAWGALPKGSYSTEGRLPAVPPNVALHAGWFKDTLAPFAAAHAGPVRLMNVDCDLYASTREVFEVFAPRLAPGSVVVFDEYLCNPGWEDEEHKALLDAARDWGFSYDYIALSLFTRQAAIRVR